MLYNYIISYNIITLYYDVQECLRLIPVLIFIKLFFLNYHLHIFLDKGCLMVLKCRNQKKKKKKKNLETKTNAIKIIKCVQ